MNNLPSYGKVLALGDPKIASLLSAGSVVAEEKVDGSHFRWAVLDGKLTFGSHRMVYDDLHPVDKLFKRGVAHIQGLYDHEPKLLPDNHVFFAELLDKPKHNTISYARTPTNHLMLFDAYDINTQKWDSPTDLADHAATFGIDGPVVLWHGDATTLTKEILDKLLETQSYLGGATIEGVVLKNYGLPLYPAPYQLNTPVGPMMGKLVRESFKEENRLEWGVGENLVEGIVRRYATNARWEKAAIHLKEEGQLEGNLRDIAKLLPEVERDVEEECADAIKQVLWEHYRHQIIRGIQKGLPVWWKEKLAAQQFEIVTPHEP